MSDDGHDHADHDRDGDEHRKAGRHISDEPVLLREPLVEGVERIAASGVAEEPAEPETDERRDHATSERDHRVEAVPETNWILDAHETRLGANTAPCVVVVFASEWELDGCTIG